MAGNSITVDELRTTCGSYVTNEEMGKSFSVNGTLLDPNAPAIPCGIAAKSMFNDTFEMYTQKGDSNPMSNINIDRTDIAWKTDLEIKFSNSGENWEAK